VRRTSRAAARRDEQRRDDGDASQGHGVRQPATWLQRAPDCDISLATISPRERASACGRDVQPIFGDSKLLRTASAFGAFAAGDSWPSAYAESS
jgi:hypothetical protein